MSTSVYTGLNPFNFIRKPSSTGFYRSQSAHRLSERTVLRRTEEALWMLRMTHVESFLTETPRPLHRFNWTLYLLTSLLHGAESFL